MKKLYTDPQVNYVFMDKDVITSSGTNKLLELDWVSGGTVISKEDGLGI